MLIIRAFKEQELEVTVGTRPVQTSGYIPPQPFDFHYAEPPAPPEPLIVPVLVSYGYVELPRKIKLKNRWLAF